MSNHDLLALVFRFEAFLRVSENCLNTKDLDTIKGMLPQISGECEHPS